MFYKQEDSSDDFEIIGPVSLEKSTQQCYKNNHLEISESGLHFLPALYENHIGTENLQLMDSENKPKFEAMMVYR